MLYRLLRALLSIVPFIVTVACEAQPMSLQTPNIVLIFADDLGYGDLGSYGAEGYETPELDQLARDGIRFTNFNVAASVCTPSRAALLTGAYPRRLNALLTFPRGVPHAAGRTNIGLHPDETTLAELLRAQGYATACFGKWHLGHHRPFMPTNQGFDEFFGIPYSNDMRKETNPLHPPLPVYDGLEIVEFDPDQTYLTQRLTERAIDFIRRKSDQPFFLYLPHPMPHIPLHASPEFAGKTERGLYGDVIAELDWSVGEIRRVLAEEGIAENTLIIFTSDNGPWLQKNEHGGSAGGLREGKASLFEGGFRVPFVAHWPEHIEGGEVSDVFFTSMDILPTVAHIVGAPLPDKPIDGKNAWNVISGRQGVESTTDYFYYFSDVRLGAVRHGQWKLMLEQDYKEGGEAVAEGVREFHNAHLPLSLFDLENDPAESVNVAEQHPEMVKHLLEKIEEFRRYMNLNNRPGGFVFDEE